MTKCNCGRKIISLIVVTLLFNGIIFPLTVLAQGITTASISGIVTDENGTPLVGANVVAEHLPSGTRYGASTRNNGQYNIYNMRIGGPYKITASYIGYREKVVQDIYLNLGQDSDVDFVLAEEAVAGEEVTVVEEVDDVLNSGRTGAATYIDREQVAQLPTIKRSTRDLTRMDPRSDGNFSFGGKNWLYNNISLDGSYFNNPFGLDDPAPGGQANAEPVPYEAVEQVQVSIAPFDVREGGFTGAGINTVTKSGGNNLQGSVYTFTRNEKWLGSRVGDVEIFNPDLSFNQSGFTLSGALIPNKLFFFINGELERRDDDGTAGWVASGSSLSGLRSRVDATIMQRIRDRMIEVYGYDPGPFEGYIFNTNSDKALAKLDWNINENNNVTLRYNYLDAFREQGPHPFVLSFNNTGRGPNESSMPFRNSGYRINNQLHSIALEWNNRGNSHANRFFASYNRFRDFREPFSEPFPTIDIGEGGVTYTTLGHEPFSIHNILNQDVLQLTNNFSLYSGNHVFTFGANFEYFSFFNSFNIFRHGVFFLPAFIPVGSTFSSLDDFFDRTDPNSPNFKDFRAMIGSGPFKGERIKVGQFAVYAQDEYMLSPKLNLTYGLRIDVPMYFTDPVDNPFSTSLTALDENDNPEKIDQAHLPGATPLFSPRVGFNYDLTGDRSSQLRGGTGIFTGRIPFVWVGNVISNPGANPNLYPGIPESEIPEEHRTSEDAVLQQSFDLNAMDPDFKWPQVWTTNLALDKNLGDGMLATLELIYSKDINAIYMRNADLIKPVRTLRDGRPFFRDENGNNELNPDGGAGIYVIDNASEGYNYSISAQLRKTFDFGMMASIGYTFQEAKNLFRSTEIASVLWQGNPAQGDPNKPNLSFSEFGNRHRIVAGATYSKSWTPNSRTHFGLVFEAAEGGRHTAGGGNRFSFIYAGDVNGDGQSNDLIYIPKDKNDINLSENDANGNFYQSVDEQWRRLNAFIEQDKYLSKHRGEIAERHGLINEWFSNLDLRILQDLSFNMGAKRHTFQLSMDMLNVLNMLNSSWGVRKFANPAALSPLQVVGFDSNGEPMFNFTGPEKTFIDDPSVNSRWQIQIGLKYFFE
jgi:hypothetical protein